MIDILRAHIIPAAYEVLPDAMASPKATAQLIAIAYQESRTRERVQISIKDGRRFDGPARGFWQFEEKGATQGVLSHAKTSTIARDALVALRYRRDLTVREVWQRLEHNDVLAAVFARLLLWTVPSPLPSSDEPEEGWRLYLAGWRPGSPHIESWQDAWRHGWAA